MPIKLVKACKELNIGLPTAVEFLKKNGHQIVEDPNTRIADELYLTLAKEYNKEMALKLESEKLRQQQAQEEVVNEGNTEEKQEESVIVESTQETLEKIQVKPITVIDLDALNTPSKKKARTTNSTTEAESKQEAPEPVAITEEPQNEVATVTTKSHEEPNQEDNLPVIEEPLTEQTEATDVVVEKEDKQVEDNNTELTQPIEESKAEEVEEKFKEEESETTELPQDEKEEAEIFSLGKRTLDNPVVIGQIDLDSLNQTTRPKSKTKEQKKKEREDKNRQQFAKKNHSEATTKNGEANEMPRKKRERIKSGKVDINKTAADIRPPKNNAKKQQEVKRPLKTEVDEEEVQRQIKETLARLSAGNKKGKGAKYRKEKREHIRATQEEMVEREKANETVLKLTEFVTANELASMMNVSVNQVIGTCMSLGLMVSINQRLDAETINIVADEFGYTTEYVTADLASAIEQDEDDYSEEDMMPRPPIVTVMGHVDHGKTSLLDHIRNTNVIAGEAGGITQHIGAYSVTLKNGQQITFLDTPGHEAFTAMRARGAKATDIAIIIVAADDNVMPQTVEAINHASAAGVPMIFAINKIDKPSANPDKIKETLANMNYLVEDWGGKYQSQDISAKTGLGVYELLEKVLLEAELLELKANPKKRATGTIIESSLDKGRGYVSTVLVSDGTLRIGDTVLAGIYHGKVKAMFNERNQRIKEAKPGEPAYILGLNGAPQAGDNFNVMPTEQEAREIANKREQLQREQDRRTHKHFTLDELGRRIALGDFKELNIIVKGDVDGSVEALSDSLIKLSTENIQINVIHKAVGAISDSDILLAVASNAIICGFQVRPTASARKMAEKEEIDVRLYSIIYDAIEEIKAAMAGMLAPELKEEVTASLEILEVFKITKVGTVAGCLVREGKIKRTNKVRVIRDGIVVYTGELASLKRMKDDVKEVGVNYECGLNIKNYNDIKVGDVIESFEEIEVKKEL